MKLTKQNKRQLLIGGGLIGGGVLVYLLTRPETSCTLDSECPSGYYCIGGKCIRQQICAVDTDCPTGQKCFDGFCKECNVNADCPTGETCQNGICKPPVVDPCEGVVCSNYCKGDDYWSRKCVNGNCVDNALIESNSPQCITPQCTTDLDCGTTCDDCYNLYSEKCTGGVCVKDQLYESESPYCGWQTSWCKMNSDCPTGWTCNNIGGSCQIGTCTAPPQEPSAQISNFSVEEELPLYPGYFEMNARITNNGPVNWIYYVQRRVKLPNNTWLDGPLQAISINKDAYYDYTGSFGPASMSGVHTFYLTVWKESSKITKIAEISTTKTWILDIDAFLGYPQISQTVAYRGDMLYFTVTATNSGNVTHTFYIGCSILSPLGTWTDSMNFCCGVWTGSPNWYCTSPCNIPNNGLKAITLAPGESGDVQFQERLGPNTPLGNHRVYMQIYPDSNVSNPLDEFNPYNIFNVNG